jgi:hypothetical protein
VLLVKVQRRKPARRNLWSASGTSGYGGIDANFSVNSARSAALIAIPCVVANIFSTALPYFGERNVGSGERQCLGIEHEVGEPQAQNGTIAKDTVEGRREGIKIKQCFVDVEDEQRKSGHGDLAFREFLSFQPTFVVTHGSSIEHGEDKMSKRV